LIWLGGAVVGLWWGFSRLWGECGEWGVEGGRASAGDTHDVTALIAAVTRNRAA
jgi:hypothetical protein